MRIQDFRLKTNLSVTGIRFSGYDTTGKCMLTKIADFGKSLYQVEYY